MAGTNNPYGENVWDTSAGAGSDAAAGFNRIGQGGAIADSINTYLSPYYDNVITDTTARMRDQGQHDLNAVGDAAQAGGAFGGARHGLVESQTMDNTSRSIAEMTNRMKQDQYNNAAQLASQDVANQMGAYGSLAGISGQAFDQGRTLNQDQMNAGNMQQQLMQAILSGASGSFDQYMNSPVGGLATVLGALGQDPRGANRTETFEPGLFDYLGLGAQVGGGYLGGK